MAPRSDSRSRMIGSAAKLLQRQGYHATGMVQVVEESSTPRGSLYFHFPEGKDQLVEEALAVANDVVAATIERVGSRSESPADFVSKLGAAMAKWLTKSDYTEGCPVSTVALEVAPANKRLTDASGRAFEHWIDAVELRLIDLGTAPDAANATAVSVIATLEGAMILCRVKQSTQPLKVAMGNLSKQLDSS